MNRFNPDCKCGHDLADHEKVWADGKWTPEGRAWVCQGDGDRIDGGCRCDEFRPPQPYKADQDTIVAVPPGAQLHGPTGMPPDAVMTIAAPAPDAALLTVLRDDGHPMIIVRRNGSVTVDGLTAADEAAQTFVEKVRHLGADARW